MTDMDNIIQAKVIILGDKNTGKTSLINNLRSIHENDTSHIKYILNQNINDNFFTIINISAEELDNSLYDVNLKCWEHSSETSTQEEQLVFRDALFCIVLIDIRNPSSANSAFNRWIELKETNASECFLFVIGTHLDQASNRRVDLKDLCKSCAKRDAIYLEISNQTNQNIQLLKKLLIQRLDYMIERKQIISNQTITPMYNNNNIDNQEIDNLMNDISEDKEYNEENKGDGYYTYSNPNPYSNNTNTQDGNVTTNTSTHSSLTNVPIIAVPTPTVSISIPALEQHIMYDSIGSILSSCLDIDHWPGLEEENNNLIEIGENINQFIEQLSMEHIHTNLPRMTVIDDIIYEQQQQQQQTTSTTVSSYHINHKLTSLNNDLIHNNSNNKVVISNNNTTTNDNVYVDSSVESYVDSAYSMNELKHAFELLGLEFPTTTTVSNTITTSSRTNIVRNDQSEQHSSASSAIASKSLSPSSGEIIAISAGSNLNTLRIPNKQSPSNSSIHSGQQQANHLTNSSMSLKNKGNLSTTKATTATTTTTTTTTTTLRKLMVKLPNGITAEIILDLTLNLNPQIDRFLAIHHLDNDELSKKKITTIVYDAYQKYTITNNHNNTNNNNNNNNTASIISNNNSIKNISHIPPPPPPTTFNSQRK